LASLPARRQRLIAAPLAPPADVLESVV